MADTDEHHVDAWRVVSRDQSSRLKKLATASFASMALQAGDAGAEPTHGWHFSLERLFGASRSEQTFEPENGATQLERHATLSVLSSRAPRRGYSAPRVGVDYLSPWGLTAGAALGVEALVRAAPESSSGLDDSAVGAVLSPRVGYHAQLSGWSLWPRLGATHLLQSRGDDRTALTFELALSLPVSGERLQLQLVPYFEVGLSEDDGRQNLSEQGVQVALALAPALAPGQQPARGQLVLSVERTFGAGLTWGPADAQPATGSVSLGLQYLERPGYDRARFGGDYVLESGLSAGTAFGYARHYVTYEGDFSAPPRSDSGEDFWLLAPRAGLLHRLSPALALWPRAGVTLLLGSRSADHAALTLELPALWLLPGSPLALTATPHVELGVAPGGNAGRFSQVGVSLGASAFF